MSNRSILPHPRALHFGHLAALGINAVVGSGIFLIPGGLAESLGAWSIGAYLFCGLLLNFVALTFARLASLTSRNGGAYVYADMAFGRNVAFFVGWVSWFTAVVSCSAVGDGLGEYLSHFFPHHSFVRFNEALAVTCILGFGLINYWGVTYGGKTMLWLTVVKVLPLIAIAIGGLSLVHSSTFTLPVHGFTSHAHFSSAIVLVLYSLCGFEVVPIISEEAKRATFSAPKAILISLWSAIVLYTIIQLGIAAGPAVGSTRPLAEQAKFLWGPLGGDVVAVAGILSIVSFISGTALSAPRLLTPLAEDGLLPSPFAKLDPRFGTPGIAILITTLATVVLVVMHQLDELMTLAAAAVMIQYLFSSAALVKLSVEGKARGAFVGAGGILVSLFLIAQVTRETWMVLLIVGAFGLAFHLGYLFYLHLERVTGKGS